MESYTIQFKKYTFTENLLKITEKQFLDKKNKDLLNKLRLWPANSQLPNIRLSCKRDNKINSG
jgi:hypothetical protein